MFTSTSEIYTLSLHDALPICGVQVVLIDTDTHRGSFSTNGGPGGGPNLGRRDQRDPSADRILEVPPGRYEVVLQDRKSTRLNSSHRCISYAVFCLKKKK